jgi:hypothetical protein
VSTTVTPVAFDGPRLASAHVAARDGGIDAEHAFLPGRRGDLDGERRFAGRHVDQDAAGPASGQGALCAQHHGADIAWKADDTEYHVAVLGDRARSIRPGGALRQQRFGFVAGAVIDRRRKAAGDQMPAHAGSHHAGANPTDAGFAGFNVHHDIVKNPARTGRGAMVSGNLTSGRRGG